MTGTSLATYDEKWAAMAKQFVTQAPVASDNSLSCRGGVFTMGEQNLGTRLVAVILDSIAVNTYFAEKWEEGKKSAPTCYAYGRPPEEMFPHIDSMKLHMDHFRPQNFGTNGEILGCGTCPMNVFGSAQTGRGKACQNRDRLALLPAGQFVPQRGGYGYDLQLFDDPTHFRDTDVVKFSLPVTSGKLYRNYVHKLQQTTGRPPFGVISVLELQPHQQNQVQVAFTMVEALPDHLFDTIVARHTAARDGMIEPFSPPSAEAQQQAQQPVQNLQRQVQPPATANFQLRR